MGKKNPSLAVIGAGAAGYFTAVNAARLMNGKARIVLFEKGREVLSKVRISGGGRCNVTHQCFDAERLSEAYPRGRRMLRWSFEQFGATDTVTWFEERGVKLKAEEDGRMFPVTDSSETIIQCLTTEAEKHGVTVQTKTSIQKIEPLQNGAFKLIANKGKSYNFDKIVVATGGYNREKAYEWLKDLGHSINKPVPSLFTFNFREKIFSDLAGISADPVQVKILDAQFRETGPLLITHWGLSGPAVLKLSAWAARELNEREYRFDIEVNWLHPLNEHQVREKLVSARKNYNRKLVTNQVEFPIPSRLWARFIELAGISPKKNWADVSNKELHQLTNVLSSGRYSIQGKTTFKEEFVTCGGIPLNEIDPDTLESKIFPGLYFVGEVLDIDGVTGGFNFQAAWTNGWLAANAIAGS
ncbi:MAG: NAD(P)/FAD-dependent oxidoreductase [Balneolaceae bacterium]|nr:MAG: NAD(P)/FAD-dependent oxidoreductase [Balneolaceae bacterium]